MRSASDARGVAYRSFILPHGAYAPWGAEIGLQSPQVQAGYRTVAGEKPRGERPVWQDLPLALP